MKKSTLYAWILAIIMTIPFAILFMMMLSEPAEPGFIESKLEESFDGVILGLPAGLSPDMTVEPPTNIASNALGFAQFIYYVLPIVFLIPYIWYVISLFKFKRKKANENEKENKDDEREDKLLECRDIFRNLFWVSFILGRIYGTLLGSICTIGKPIIYLYPEQTQEVSVKLGNEELVTVSYPKYEDSWKVVAEPNGDLTDLETGRKLYALYYESEALTCFKVEDEGFVIKGEDSAEFLEEKLEILGLNYKEAEEFIVYWLPKLEANKYNYIRFATREEIEKNMPLEISGEPDSVIRVIMTYKGLRKPIEVREQQLTTPLREGFVVVEWGGTEIK